MKRITAIVVSLALSATLLLLWMLSYKSYGLIAHDAYSGVGTELVSLNGQVVFYYFDSYQGPHPPQSWRYGFLNPASRQGERLKADFDFSVAPHWWNRWGFNFNWSDTAFTGHTKVLLVSAPYWFLSAALISFVCLLYYRRRGSRQHGSMAPGNGLNGSVNDAGEAVR